MFNLFKSKKEKTAGEHLLAMQQQQYEDAIRQLHQQGLDKQKAAMSKAMMMNASMSSSGGLGAIGGSGGGGAGGSIGGSFTHTMSPGQIFSGSTGATLHPIGTGTCARCGYENDIQNVHCHLCNEKLNFKEIILSETASLKVDAVGRAGWYGTSGTSA